MAAPRVLSQPDLAHSTRSQSQRESFENNEHAKHKPAFLLQEAYGLSPNADEICALDSTFIARGPAAHLFQIKGHDGGESIPK